DRVHAVDDDFAGEISHRSQHIVERGPRYAHDDDVRLARRVRDRCGLGADLRAERGQFRIRRIARAIHDRVPVLRPHAPEPGADVPAPDERNLHDRNYHSGGWRLEAGVQAWSAFGACGATRERAAHERAALTEATGPTS